MTDTTQAVELVIRAKNLSKKTLGDVQKEIEALNKSLEDQVAASERGLGSLKDLEKVYKDLDKALGSLSQQQAAIAQFERQEAALAKLEQQLADNRKRLADHEATMASSEKTTKRQAAQLVSYTNAVTKTEQAIERQTSRLESARVAGEALGLSMDNLGDAQNQILATGRRLSDVYDLQASAVDNFADNMSRANKVTQAAADADLFDRQAQDAAQLVKAGEYVNFWVAALEKKEAAERDMAAERNASEQFERDAKAAADLNKAGQYVDFWTRSLDELDATQKKVAAGQALNKMADDAIAASRGYTTLSNSTKRLVQNNNQLQKSIQGILDPAAAQRGTLAGVEEQITNLAAAISKIKGPATEYKAQVAGLTAANKQLQAQAAGIDAYTKQVAALREARAQFVQNRAELLQYAQSIRSAESPTAEMQARLRALQGAVAASSSTLQAQVVRTREMRTALREAGVETNNLAGAQTRLLNAARTSTTALTQLGAAAQKYGTEVDEAGRRTNAFGENGRTTLSLLQRIRGEVLALAAAYVGLQGAIGLANDSINASNTKQGVMNQLGLSVGDDPKAIAEEYQYIREQADRIGISFEEAARGYAKFAAAARLAGRSMQEVRYVFESASEVGRVANLSAADMDGVFKALEQIYSKGAIQAEELRGQLGDRLFGAFEVAAIALKDQFPDLGKAMKEGQVSSEQLLLVMEKYREMVANRLPTAMESLAGDQARLNSAFFDFKVLIAESGFADQYQRLVQELSKFLNSDDGKKFAEGLSQAFGAVVTALTFLLEHLDEVQLAVELAFGLKAASLVAGLAATISSSLIPALRALIPQLLATGTAGITAFGKIRTAFALLTAAFIGWEIGKYASEKFEVVRQAGVALVIGVMKLFTQLEYKAKEVWLSMSTSWQDVAATLINSLTKTFRSILDLFGKAARAAGADGIADAVSSVTTALTVEGSDQFKKGAAELRAQLQKELSAIDDIGFDMFQAASDAARAAESAAEATKNIKATERPDISPSTKKDDGKAQKEYEKLVKKRIALADQLVRALEQAEGKIQRNEKLSLEQRLAAIDTEYAKVFRKIDELAKLPGGAAQAAQMRTTLQGYVEQLKIQETLKFNTEEMARTEKTLNDQIALRNQLLSTIQAQQKAGDLTALEARQKMAAVDAEMVPNIQAAADAAIQFALANKEVFADQTAMDTYIAKLKGIKAAVTETSDSLDILTDTQASMMVAGGLTDAFDQFAQSIANGENAVDSLKDAFLTFVADFLKKIALMIIQQIIFNALQNSNIGGWIAGAVNGAANSNAGQKHSGGLIGSGYGGVKVSTNPAWFNNAPKYHTGGVVGLAPDEYPAILQRNEEVLAANDPRNVLNGGAAGGNSAAPALQDVSVFNYVDAESFMGAALSKSSGQKKIMNVLSANRSQLKALVNG